MTAGELGRIVFFLKITLDNNDQSQEDLAYAAGVNPTTVSNIFRGKQWPEYQMVDRLVRACGRSLAAAQLQRTKLWADVDPDEVDLPFLWQRYGRGNRQG